MKIIILIGALAFLQSAMAYESERYLCKKTNFFSPEGKPIEVLVDRSIQNRNHISLKLESPSDYYPGCGQTPYSSYIYTATYDLPNVILLEVSAFDAQQTIMKELSGGNFRFISEASMTFEFSSAFVTHYPVANDQCKPSWSTFKWNFRILNKVSKCVKI